MSRSTSSRPMSSSRTAPPTSHASSFPRTWRTSSSIDDLPGGPLPARIDAAGDLVVDRPGDAGMLLGEKTVADQRDLLSRLKLSGQLDREGIHRDRAHSPAPL